MTRIVLCVLAVVALGQDQPNKTAIETPHLTLATSSIDASSAPGRKITLIAEIELKPGLHVYAPGVGYGYIPISWSMAESKSWVAFPVAFPKARTMEFPVLKEIVPVYEGNLRLVRDVTIQPEALSANGVLALEGTFRYQACDDRQCFPPRTIPLKWTFRK